MLAPRGAPRGSSTNLGTTLTAWLQPLEAAVGSSLASNPNVCIHYMEDAFLCGFPMMEMHKIDKTEP